MPAAADSSSDPGSAGRPPSGRLRFAILGSGSRGNSLVVASGRTRVLIDCGFSVKETERRLARLGLEATKLAAIVLTHEHNDHASGAEALARRYRLPLWLTPGTAQALGGLSGDDRLAVRHFRGDEGFNVDDLMLEPFPVPHDAREPCQFVFSNGAHRLGLLTDAGHVTTHMASQLRNCDALVLECNHDLDMLADCDYPPSVRTRIAGRHGHLDNDSAAALLAGLDGARLQHIVAAHLSEKNNTPWLARSALGSALGGAAERVDVASQDGGLGWRELV